MIFDCALRLSSGCLASVLTLRYKRENLARISGKTGRSKDFLKFSPTSGSPSAIFDFEECLQKFQVNCHKQNGCKICK